MQENTSIVDPERAEEMNRLIEQDRLISQYIGGLFPQQLDLAHAKDILDIGCGPGGWCVTWLECLLTSDSSGLIEAPS